MNSKSASQDFTGGRIEERALWIVDNIPAMVAYWDANQVCAFANGAYREWFGRTRESMVGITLKELLGPLYELNLPYIRGALDGKMQIFEREIPRPDGSSRHTLATYRPHVENGVVQGFFVHVADVTLLKELALELKAAKEMAERLATHDFLTGLPNRVLFEDRVASAIAQARRWNEIVAVISVDLDDFKSINDTCGHLAGDKVLVEVARRMKQAVRETDCVARFGGDEFVIVCSELRTVADVEVVVNRILAQIRLPMSLAGEFLALTCSIGVALYPGSGQVAADLLVRSDRAMYESKRLGKNQYTVISN